MFCEDENKTALAFILSSLPLHTPSLGSSGVFVSQTMFPLNKANMGTADSVAKDDIDSHENKGGTQLIDLHYAIMEKQEQQLQCFGNHHSKIPCA
ncbi:unnamed protein product [Peronospora destructor]|uniref:Uncharacterized protein n=1 Tax=Peronospora destructor TaxID=86335 RepID=A0AAV0TKY9_9STRA|nr:unnamed protein product [Peronospora destructor]